MNEPIPITRRQRFSMLMREHHQELLIFAGAITKDADSAKDIVQDSFVAAWGKFDEFDVERDFAKWMRGFVRNKSKDWFRKYQREAMPSDLDLVEIEIDITSWQSARAANIGLFETLEACLTELPDNLRSAVNAFYIDNLQGNDAAEVLGISPANLRKRLERSRALLHRCLENKFNSSAENIEPNSISNHARF